MECSFTFFHFIPFEEKEETIGQIGHHVLITLFSTPPFLSVQPVCLTREKVKQKIPPEIPIERRDFHVKRKKAETKRGNPYLNIQEGEKKQQQQDSFVHR